MDVFIRKPYNYDGDEVSRETGLDQSGEESMTVQSFCEECDINVLARRFGLFGQMPEGVAAPFYGDFEGISDYHAAMNAIAQANEAFDSMPAEVRARFHNNPAEFVDFCSDEKNVEDMRKMGLMVPQAVELAAQAAAPEAAPAAPDGTVST